MIDTSDSVLVVLFVLLNIQLVQCVIELIALSAREILVPVRSTVMGALVKALFASVMMTLLTLFNLCGWYWYMYLSMCTGGLEIHQRRTHQRPNSGKSS